ncbi:hypothetical protein E4U54_003914 [Claviceps lovelessii]|nr:hypothetical protein E4U54_003914 [Claviceps lovelessii]
MTTDGCSAGSVSALPQAPEQVKLLVVPQGQHDVVEHRTVQVRHLDRRTLKGEGQHDRRRHERVHPPVLVALVVVHHRLVWLERHDRPLGRVLDVQHEPVRADAHALPDGLQREGHPGQQRVVLPEGGGGLNSEEQL